jgi:hypothetical protein
VPKIPSRLTRRAAIAALTVAPPALSAEVAFVAPADLDHIEG